MTEPIEPASSPVASRTKNRWFAAVLGLAAIGLGQAYAGRPKRAAVVLACYAILFLGLPLSLTLQSGWLFLAVSLGAVVFVIGTAFDAWRLVGRERPTARFAGDRWYAYGLVAAIWTFGVSPKYQGWLKAHVAQAFRIPSGAMEPTIATGDWLVATPLHGALAREQLVIFRSDDGPLVMRIAGLPGDTLEMRTGLLFVDDRVVAEPYRKAEDADVVDTLFLWQRRFTLAPGRARTPSVMTWGPLVVPSGRYFMLGDNRGDSNDSRYRGFIDGDSLWLSPRMIYFSWDAEHQAVRWSRIGLALR